MYIIVITLIDLGETDILLLYMGDAVNCMGFVEMKRVENLYQVGWVVYAKGEVCIQWEWTHVYNSTCPVETSTGHKPFPYAKKLTDFTTRFFLQSFTVNTIGFNSSRIGDGMAFFLIPPNTAGAWGGLGLLNVTNYFSAQNQIVLVEFDPNVNDGQDGILNFSLLFCFQQAYHVTQGTEPRKTIVV